MDMRELELLVPTLFGLEGLCAEELRRLKLPEVAAENGRVRCKAAPADIPRVNLNLRTGERVLLVVGRYRAADFEALFEGCRALPWEEFIPREGAFPVKGHSLNSQLHAVPAVAAGAAQHVQELDGGMDVAQVGHIGVDHGRVQQDAGKKNGQGGILGAADIYGPFERPSIMSLSIRILVRPAGSGLRRMLGVAAAVPSPCGGWSVLRQNTVFGAGIGC